MADKRLQVFQAVAKELSFTKAAEIMHMTQPAVTFQIRQLEESFNTRLFDRAHNRVSMTPAGEVVLGYSEKIFKLYAEMESQVNELTGNVNGDITLGASTTISEYMLPSLLGEYSTKNPDVKLRLRVSNSDGIVSMIENNVIDLGIVEGPINNKNLVVNVCSQDELAVVVPVNHELAGKSSVSPAELEAYNFITREKGSGTREVVSTYFADNAVDKNLLKNSMELGSSEAIKGAITSGIGISILSKNSISKEEQLGTLAAVPLNPPLTRNFSFVHQRQKFKVTAMNELLKFSKEYYGLND